MKKDNVNQYTSLLALTESVEEAAQTIQLLNEALRNSPSRLAFQKLTEGNRRFREEKQDHPRMSTKRRKQVISNQNPFAIILSCADSRVPPEVIFDQGIGDLFVIRMAGNIASAEVIASIEYAVEHLSPSLLLVLGHENCGAVHAACDSTLQSPNLKALLDYITISLSGNIATHQEPNLVAKQHAVSTAISCVNQSSILQNALDDNTLAVIAGYYSLNNGSVEFLDLVQTIQEQGMLL